ncbi:MAG: hypothetical protein EZS28_053935, partial [Streblomastix strix]
MENELFEMRMSLEEINEKLTTFSKLSSLERDIIFVNIIKQFSKGQEQMQQALNIGLVDKNIDILNQLPVEEVYPLYYQGITSLFQLSSDEQRRIILFEKGLMKYARKAIDCKIECVLENSTHLVQRIIEIVGQSVGDTKENPLRQIFEKDGTIARIIEIFHDDTIKDKRMKRNSAVSIAMLYRALSIPSNIG